MLEGQGLTRLSTSWNWILTLGKLRLAGIFDVSRLHPGFEKASPN